MGDVQEKTPGERIIERHVEDELKESYLTFAMSVIVSRALPDVRDGLKPSQRRILVAMNDLNLSPRSKHRKCAKICGDTSGNYHPHGEQVVYPTLVRIAQPFSIRYPLVDGQGNFGSIDGDPPAAMRYTEARFSSVATELLADLDLDTVDFQPNYDETLKEPVVLPSRFPNLAANGSSGIAVGMSTEIPPHNIRELVKALVMMLDHPDCSVDDLMSVLPGPDFPTGGCICGRAGVSAAYRSGQGHITLRGKLHVEETPTKKTIVITEIPYQVVKTRIIDDIVAGIKGGRIRGVSDVRDESDREGMRLVVDVTRGENADVVINQIHKHTPFQRTYAANMIALVRGRPRLLPLKDLLGAFLRHREECVTRRTRFLLSRDEARRHILDGLLIALDKLDEVIALIRSSDDPAAARSVLCERLPLTAKQADAILAMRLQRLTGLERARIETEHEEVSKRIEEYRGILADRSRVRQIIRDELLELRKKYGDARRTTFAESAEEILDEELIAEETMAVTLSREGYIKRQPLSTYRAQRRGGKGIIGMSTRDEDFPDRLYIADTHDYLLFFSGLGRVHWLKVYEVPQMSRAAKGRAIVNLLHLEQDEEVTSCVPVRTFDPGNFVFMATMRGVVKKTSLEGFSRPRRGGIAAVKLDPDDKLIGVELTDGSAEVFLATRKGVAIHFHEDNVRPMGRTARGVRGISLRGDDGVVALVAAEQGSRILTVCKNGYGKRTDISAYRRTRRGGKGVVNIDTGRRNGPVVACMAVRDEDEFMAMTSRGHVIRCPVKDVRITGRGAQGVRLVSSKESSDYVVSVARIEPEDGGE